MEATWQSSVRLTESTSEIYWLTAITYIQGDRKWSKYLSSFSTVSTKGLKVMNFFPHIPRTSISSSMEEVYIIETCIKHSAYSKTTPILTAWHPTGSRGNRKQWLHLSLHTYIFKLRTTVSGPRTPNITKYRAFEELILKWNVFLLFLLADV